MKKNLNAKMQSKVVAGAAKSKFAVAGRPSS